MRIFVRFFYVIELLDKPRLEENIAPRNEFAMDMRGFRATAVSEVLADQRTAFEIGYESIQFSYLAHAFRNSSLTVSCDNNNIIIIVKATCKNISITL